MYLTKTRTPVETDFEAMNDGDKSLARRLWFALCVFGVLGAGIYYLSKSIIATTVIAGGLFASSAYSNISFFRNILSRKAMQNDALAVEEIHVKASRIIDVIPRGDDDPAWVFFGGPEDEALLLVGQWLQEVPKFPALEFVIHRWNDSKKRIRIEVISDVLEPEEASASILLGYRYDEIEFFKAKFDTLQEDLGTALEKRA